MSDEKDKPLQAPSGRPLRESDPGVETEKRYGNDFPAISPPQPWPEPGEEPKKEK